MKIKFCPKCKSTNVKTTTSLLAIIGGGIYWLCEDCGFTAPQFPDENDKIKKRSKLKKNNKEQTNLKQINLIKNKK